MNIYRVLLTEWKAKYYAGKSPTIQTLKRRIDRGIIPGTTEAGDYIVYCDAHYNPKKPNWERGQPTKTGNTLADEILKRHTANR